MRSQLTQSLTAPVVPDIFGLGLGRLLSTPIRLLLCRGVLALVLLLAFRTVQSFPGMTAVQEGWFGLSWLLLFLAWVPWKIATGFRVYSIEIYALLLLATGVFMAAWGAWRVFDQPWPYGIVAERGLGTLGVWLLLFEALRRNRIRLADVNGALLFLAWGTFVLYSAMRLFLNPASFASYGVGFVTFSIDRVASFKLAPYFILYGVFYYALRGIRGRRTSDYILAAALFLFGALGLTERWLTLTTVLTILFFLFRWRPFSQFAGALIKLALVAGAGLAITLFVDPNFVAQRESKFADAFMVVTTGAEGADSSANARLLETVMVIPYIERHPLIGNGVLSHQWQGGSHAMLGDMFYESDIGVIGVVYSYGLIGLLIFAMQYGFAFRSARRLGPEISDPIVDAVKGFVFFTAMYSVTTGIFVWDVPITFFFVILLAAIEINSGQLVQSFPHGDLMLPNPCQENPSCAI